MPPSSELTTSCHRTRGKSLGVPELIAIALGGMVGGGIFTILGVSVAMIGAFTPVAIVIGGLIASLAAYSYVKLGVYYRDEGATYSFFKRSFPDSPLAASLIGWWVIFGYISTLALYAYTFASYALSGSALSDTEWLRKLVAGAVLLTFTLINLWSVKGMGKIEDIMVYTKLLILGAISFLLISHGNASLPTLIADSSQVTLMGILVASSITFVAYEGFQLVINAVEEMEQPERNIPRAIYAAIFLATTIYVVISLGAILAIPFDEIIRNQEYALAAGAENLLGHRGTELIIVGALLATSSAISGTVFGASRQMAVIAADGYFPRRLAHRAGRVPGTAIIAMSALAFLLVLVGSLQEILEFGSVTFLLVSLLMAVANYKMHRQTGASRPLTLIAIAGLGIGTLLILYYEAINQPRQLVSIVGLYLLLSLGAWLYARHHHSSPAD
jgi:amino acid transporter